MNEPASSPTARLQFSIRRLLLVTAIVAIVVGVAVAEPGFYVGLAMICLSAVFPAILATRASATNGYARVFYVGCLAPATVAAVTVAHDAALYTLIPLGPIHSFRQTIETTGTIRPLVIVYWTLIPVAGSLGVVVHWFLRPRARPPENGR